MINRLELKNFRSHEEFRADLSPHTNVIIGPNGAGKTNILEALVVIARGKSYRGDDQDLVRYEADHTTIITEIDRLKRSLVIEKKADSLEKSYFLKGKKFRRLSFAHSLPLVLFEPEFTQLLVRGPSLRRDYIDGVLSSTLPNYQPLLGRYRRTLAQRNALLKVHSPSEDQLFVWDIKLSELAAQIVTERLALVNKIKSIISDTYSNLAGAPHKIGITYQTKTSIKNYANALLGDFRSNLALDKERGFTSRGPHRDDLQLTINNKPAELFASRGETRTLLLSLKIFELVEVEASREAKPLLLLDDVFSELDESRQTRLIEYFKDNQVVITTTNVTPLMKGVSGNIIEL